jgi:4-amino-4-deoxy-L-arabinose transferase-like glycosyltransferase
VTAAESSPYPRLLFVVVTSSLILNLVGIWWGLPSRYGWAVDELNPRVILEGIETRFSGDWHQPAYPPFHYYLLAATYVPVLALDVVDPMSVEGHTTFFVFGRLLSLAMGAGIVVLLYRLGRDLFESRAGLFAALSMALPAPFVYYAKTANLEVPLLFWFLLSLSFFQRMHSRGELRDYLSFSLSAVLAMGTKDQAFAFYVLPLAVFFVLRLRRERSIGRILLDRRILLSLVAALLAFAALHNVVFNYRGFVHHFEEILWARGQYSLFEGTLGHQLAMLRQTFRHLGFALGLPLALGSALGVFLALGDQRLRPSALWILLFGTSYYLFFIIPVLSTWLRYALPLAALLSLFAGLACSRLWEHGHSIRALVGAALLYSLGRAVSMDALLLHDARYAAERWLRENVSTDEVVGYVGPEYYLPRLHEFSAIRLRPAVTVLERERPDFLVVNPDYGSRFEPGTREHELFSKLASGRTSYALAFSLAAREESPRWSLLDFAGVLANLSKVSPPIEIYALTD